MMFVRVLLVQDVGHYLKKAVTIAVRYSIVRRQSTPNEKNQEMQIIDYVTQQFKLFPLVATCFAIWYSANYIWKLYNEVSFNSSESSTDLLPELHALACCLKAVCTSDAAAGVEICRLCCGGHGYMTSSNLPTTYGLVTATCTYEGENNVLLLQTARYLMKAYKLMLDGKNMSSIMSYLKKRHENFNTDDLTLCIIQLMEKVASEKIALAYRKLQSKIKSGLDSDRAWNQTSIDLVAASEAHCRAFMLNTYRDRLFCQKNKLSRELFTVLEQLNELYVISIGIKFTGDFLKLTNIPMNYVQRFQERLEELLALIRPNIIGVVDGFDIADEVLSSTLGAYDGNVYERLFKEALKSPLNADLVNESFEKYLKPLMKSKL